MRTDNEYLGNKSVVYWSRRYGDGRYASGGVRWRVPVRCGGCREERAVSASGAQSSSFTGLCRACVGKAKVTEDEELVNGSVIHWSRRFKDGRNPGGQVRYRVPVRCGGCEEERVVGANVARRSDFTGLCRACAHLEVTEDEVLASGSVLLWSRRFEAGLHPNGKVRHRVPVRCGGCGEVRVVDASTAHSSGYTGLCPACVYLDRKIHIPKATLERLYHDENLFADEIAARLGCSQATVLNRMREYSIELRPRGGGPQTLVPDEVLHRWSSDLAYVVGMITTDGNLVRGCNKVSFGSTDYQWIETYQECLQISAPVYEQPPQEPGRKTLYTVAISDPDYRAFLEGVGLTPAKTKERTLGPLNVPNVFFRDFLRACIDGDGGIYAYPQKNCSSLGLRVNLCSVCRPFLKWVGKTVERLIDLEASGLYWKSGETWALEYYDGKGRWLLSWTYYAPDLPCLERKWAVWEEYLRHRACLVGDT